MVSPLSARYYGYLSSKDSRLPSVISSEAFLEVIKLLFGDCDILFSTCLLEFGA